MASPLSIVVITPAGAQVGEFEVQATAMVKKLKDDLASFTNVHVGNIKLLHGETDLEDTFRWTDTSVSVRDAVMLVLVSRELLQDKTIKHAVEGYAKGGETKIEIVEKYGHISYWDTSNVTTMERLFEDENEFFFNEDLSAWDVSNVTRMDSIFLGASMFNGDLSAWNVGNVTSMSRMFQGAQSFNSDLRTWNVSRVTDMSFMFYRATSFYGDLSAWNVANVADMRGMFWGHESFNGDFSAWNVGNVSNMSFMFYNARSFNGDLSAWNVAHVTDMQHMFSNNRKFSADLSAWDVPNDPNDPRFPRTTAHIEQFRLSRPSTGALASSGCDALMSRLGSLIHALCHW